MRLHIILTLAALGFFGFNIAKPGFLQKLHSEDRTCKLVKGRVDCVTKLSEYRINAPIAAYSF